MDLVIKNCRLVDRLGEYNIKVEDGKIADISKTHIKGDDVIDIKNNYIMPGFIDPHIHFRDPGLTQKEDFKTGSLSAANGGIKRLRKKFKLPKISLLLILNFKQDIIPLKRWKRWLH